MIDAAMYDLTGLLMSMARLRDRLRAEADALLARAAILTEEIERRKR
jgi:hypothetical protein